MSDAVVRVYPPGRYVPQTYDEYDGSVTHEGVVQWTVSGTGVLVLDRPGVPGAVMYAPGAWGRIEVEPSASD